MSTAGPGRGASVVDPTGWAAYGQGVHIVHTSHICHTLEEDR